MSRRSLAPLLALLAVLALGLFWLVNTVLREEQRPADSVAAAAPAEHAQPPSTAPAPALGATQEPAPAPGPVEQADIETSATPAARESVASAEADLELKDALWVEGRVIVPDGTPADEHVEVLADGKKFESRPLHRAPLAPDGSFRVAFAKDTKKGRLDLHARFLYLAEPLALSPSEPPKDIVLAPKIGGCIRGRLVLPANALDRGPSIAGTEIHVSGMSDSGRWDDAERVQRKTAVGVDLGFEIGGLPEARQYWVNVHPKDMVDASRNQVRVKAGHVLALDLELQLGARVVGRVIDEKGLPIEGVQLVTLVERGLGSSSSGQAAKTGADGTFTIAGIQPGKLSLEAKKAGLTRGISKVGDLADGAVTEGIEIALGRGLSVSGRVTWPDGRPAAGCRIGYRNQQQAGQDGFYEGPEDAQVASEGDGSFEITGLAEASITLTAQARPEKSGGEGEAGVAPARKKKSTEPYWIAHVENVKPGTNGLALTLQAGGSVRGRAVDDTGQPVESFRVSAEPVDGSQPWERGNRAVRNSFKSAEGAFTLDGLHDGDWEITAEAKGHAKSSTRRVALPRDNAPLDLVLPRAATLSGVALDPSGKPVARALVRARAPDEERNFVLNTRGGDGKRTDPDGRFELSDVAPGPEKLVATAEGWADSEGLELELQPGQSLSGLTLTLRRGGRVVGEVLDAAGHPDGNRPVNLNGMRGRDYRNQTADASGHFEFEGLSPGKYWLTSEPTEKEIEALTPENGERNTAAWMTLQKQAVVDVTEGETAHVVLGGAPHDAVRVHGTITSGGRPVSGCLVWVYGASSGDQTPHSGSSDAQGRYEVSLEGAGEYSFNIQDEKRGTSFSDTVKVPAQASFEHDILLPGGRIAGRVIGPDGQPVAKVSVSIAPDVRTAALSSNASYGQSETDEKGAFAFDGLKGGSYRLDAGDQPWRNQPTKTGKYSRSGIQLEEGGRIDDLEVRLQPACRVEGLVTGPDGRPFPGASVFARDEQGNLVQAWPQTISDSSGRFGIDGLSPGKVTIAARTKKLASVESAPVAVRSGETAQVELSLRPGTRLRVVVKDKDGAVVGAMITVANDRGQEVGDLYAFFDEELFGQPSSEPGQRVGPLPPGRYKITATNHDRVSASQDVSLSGQEEEVVALRLGG
jgi:protocatechuate 3,4-dioxygenase beta subunit